MAELDETSVRPIVEGLSQKDFCEYLGVDQSNVAAKAKRRRQSAEDYLKTIALERKGEVWKREPGIRGKWIRVEE